MNPVSLALMTYAAEFFSILFVSQLMEMVESGATFCLLFEILFHVAPEFFHLRAFSVLF
jgi:hypothetical protein